MSAHLDWNDPAAVARWLLNLRVAIDDAEDIARDMLRPERSRELGPRMHRQMHRDASAGVRRLLDYADPSPTPDPGADGSEPDGGVQ